MQTKSLISLVVLLAILSISQGYVFPDDKCCCSSRTWDTNSLNLIPNRYIYPSKNMTLLFRMFLTRAHDIQQALTFINHLEDSLRAQLWNEIRNQMAVEYSLEDALGKPFIGDHLINFCTKSRYGRQSSGRMLAANTASSSQPNQPQQPQVQPYRELEVFFPYPYFRSVEDLTHQNYERRDGTELILLIDYNNPSTDPDFNFIIEENDFDGSKQLDEWAHQQLEYTNYYLCSLGYEKYIQQTFDKAERNKFDDKSTQSLLTRLMTITFPNKFAKDILIKWVAKIIRALNSGVTTVDNLVCIRNNYPKSVKKRWSQGKDCANGQCYSDCNSQC